MAPTRSVTLTAELYERASREAQAQGKTTDELTSDALAAYLALRQLDRLQAYGQQRADELGSTDADVPRLIAELREESGQPASWMCSPHSSASSHPEAPRISAHNDRAGLGVF